MMRRMDHRPERAQGSRVVILGVPADDRSSFARGAAAAPDVIRAAFLSSSSNLTAENGIDLEAPGLLADCGDLPLGGLFDAAAIEAGAVAVLACGAALVALGGDHAVSYPLLRAHAGRHGRGLSILHVDAHPDLYEDFVGDRFSHACPFARILEEGLVSRLVQVGIRGANRAQQAQAARYGVEVVDMDAWASGTRPQLEGEWYLSIDLDGLDPAFAPGVSHREPGGLSTRELLHLVRHAGGRLVGADVVEYNPSRDVGDLTARVAAKLLKEVCGRLAAGGGTG
jgi:arginase